MSFCVCVCFCVQLTKLLISLVLEDIFFWNILESFPGCMNYFHMITNFLHVLQSVSWLTSLLKLHIGLPQGVDEISFRFFGDIPLMLVQWFQIVLICLYVYQSYLAICTIVLLLDVWNGSNFSQYSCRAIRISVFDVK